MAMYATTGRGLGAGTLAGREVAADATAASLLLTAFERGVAGGAGLSSSRMRAP